MLFFPVRDARLGARGGGDVEEDAHGFSSRAASPVAFFPAHPGTKVTGSRRAMRELFRFALTRFGDRQAKSTS